MVGDGNTADIPGRDTGKNGRMDVLNVREAARYLRYSPSNIYDKVKRNEIPYIRDGGRITFLKIALFNWLVGKLSGPEVPGIGEAV